MKELLCIMWGGGIQTIATILEDNIDFLFFFACMFFEAKQTLKHLVRIFIVSLMGSRN